MNILLSFLYGGILVSSINYVSNTFSDPALATIIAAAPIGIMSVFFIQNNRLKDCYVRNYISTTFIHVIASSILYIMMRYYHFPIQKALYISLGIWFSLQFLKYGLLNWLCPSFLYP